MDKSKLKKRFTKIAENDVLVEYLAKDNDGKDIVVDSEEIGEKGIEQKRMVAQAQIDYLNSLTKTKKNEIIAKHEVEIAEADALEVEINKVL